VTLMSTVMNVLLRSWTLYDILKKRKTHKVSVTELFPTSGKGVGDSHSVGSVRKS
jgi:hypothetical protein